MIDQGFCFNVGEWSLPNHFVPRVYTQNVVYRGIRGWESFEPQLGKLEALDPKIVFGAAKGIPPHWYGDMSQLEHLVEQLVARRKIVRRLVDEVRCSPNTPFENWR